MPKVNLLKEKDNLFELVKNPVVYATNKFFIWGAVGGMKEHTIILFWLDRGEVGSLKFKSQA